MNITQNYEILKSEMNITQNYEILKSDRQSDVLLLDGHLYFLNACSLNKKYWKCVYAYRNCRNGEDPTLKCGGRAKSTEGYAECSIPHNHTPDTDAVELMRRYGTVNVKGTTEPVTSSNIMPTLVLNYSNGENSTLDQFNDGNQRGRVQSPMTEDVPIVHNPVEIAQSFVQPQFRTRRSAENRSSNSLLPTSSKKSASSESKKPKLDNPPPTGESVKVEIQTNLEQSVDEPLAQFLRKLNEAATIADQSSSSNIETNAETLADLSFNPGPSNPVVKMTRTETFSSAHRLHNPRLDLATNRRIYGKCNNANGHGHNYTWTVTLEGAVDPNTGMVYNLATLKEEMAAVLELVDHKNLDKDIAYFKENRIVTTTENLAVFLYNELALRMENPGLLKKVVVNETPKNGFSYSGKQNF